MCLSRSKYIFLVFYARITHIKSIKLAFPLKGEWGKIGVKPMNYEIFEELLKKAKINKKEFT